MEPRLLFLILAGIAIITYIRNRTGDAGMQVDVRPIRISR